MGLDGFGDEDSTGQAVKTQQVDNSVTTLGGDDLDPTTDIASKILSDLEDRIKAEKREQELVQVLKPVSAPAYEAVGPSLVYNCTEQHWACVEPNAYKECRQNYSWNSKNGLPIECYPFASIDDNFDCATVQQEKIDSVGDTSFCR